MDKLLENVKTSSTSLLLVIDVKVKANGMVSVDLRKSKRSNDSSQPQHNHVVPVAIFLASLQHRLKMPVPFKQLFADLSYAYQFFEIQPDTSKNKTPDPPAEIAEAVKEHFNSKFENAQATDPLLPYALESVLRNYIIPLIYNAWNNRENAIFAQTKSSSDLGKEGSQIKKLKAEFISLCENRENGNQIVNNFNQLKTKIETFVKNYNACVDIPKDPSEEQFFSIMRDAKQYLCVLVDCILNSENNAGFLLDTKGSLKKEVQDWYVGRLKQDAYGPTFIEQKISNTKKSEWLGKWEKYKKSNPERATGFSDTAKTTESEGNDAKNSSKSEPIKKSFEYNKLTIEQILMNHAKDTNNVSVILDFNTDSQPDGNVQEATFVVNQFISKINTQITEGNTYINPPKKKRDDLDKYCLVVYASSRSLDVFLAFTTHLSNADQLPNKWKLDVSFFAIGSSFDKKKIIDNIKRGLQPKAEVNIDESILNEISAMKTSVEQLVEYAKLSINYYKEKNVNGQFILSYKQEIRKIENASPATYIKMHEEESKLNTTNSKKPRTNS